MMMKCACLTNYSITTKLQCKQMIKHHHAEYLLVLYFIKSMLCNCQYSTFFFHKVTPYHNFWLTECIVMSKLNAASSFSNPATTENRPVMRQICPRSIWQGSPIYMMVLHITLVNGVLSWQHSYSWSFKCLIAHCWWKYLYKCLKSCLKCKLKLYR